MPDETLVSTSPTQNATESNGSLQPEIKEQVDALMQRQGLMPASVTDNPAPIQTTDTTIVSAEPVLIPFDPFKEKFGYNTAEDAIAEIEQLRAYKATPQLEPFKFENEESEKLFRAWQEGRKDEVYNYLAEQKRLEQYASAEVDEKTADDILKLDMQVKYKKADVNLSAEDINRLFNRQYNIPKEPIQGDLEDDTEFATKKADWQEQVNDIVAQKILDAKIAKPNIVAAKVNLKFPELNNTVDNDYIEYQKNLKLGEEIEAEDREAYKSFTPKSIETRAKFIDETNGIDFEFQYEPDAEGFKEAVAMASDINAWFKSFIGQDGKPNRQEFLDAVYFSKNKQKVIMEAIKQGSNARMKAQLPDNTTGGLVRQMAQGQEPNELDLLMQRATAGFMPRNGRR